MLLVKIIFLKQYLVRYDFTRDNYLSICKGIYRIRSAQRPSTDGMSSVNGSNYSGASGRQNTWLLSESFGGVSGGVDVVDVGAAVSVASRGAIAAGVTAAGASTGYSSAGDARALLLCHFC